MYKIVITDYFKKRLKKLTKKDKKLKEILKFELLNFDRTASLSIGFGIYKLRLRRAKRGKSGGYRLHIFLMESEKILTPIYIYSKGDRDNIDKGEISKHLGIVKAELAGLL